MCNRGPSDTMANKFYEETLQCWSELQVVKTPTADIIYNETIWENRYITIQNRPIIWRLWQENGITQIYNIIRDDGEFLDHNEIQEMYGINCNFLNVLQIRQSLPLNWRQLIKNKAVTTKVSVPFVNFNGKPTPLVTAATNMLYNQFIKKQIRKTSWHTEMAICYTRSDIGRGMVRYLSKAIPMFKRDKATVFTI